MYSVTWGDEFDPAPKGPALVIVDPDDRPLHLGYVDAHGNEIDPDAVGLAPGPAANSTWEYRR